MIASTRTRTQNTPLEAEHDFHFTIEAAPSARKERIESRKQTGARDRTRLSLSPFYFHFSPFSRSVSGRQGIRTLTTKRPHGLANRPGKPYPATFQRLRREISGRKWRVVEGAFTFPSTFHFHSSTLSRSVVDRRGVEPRFSGCKPDVVPLDQQPLFRKVRPGIEPEPRPYQGRVLPQHLQTVAVD